MILIINYRPNKMSFNYLSQWIYDNRVGTESSSEMNNLMNCLQEYCQDNKVEIPQEAIAREKVKVDDWSKKLRKLQRSEKK